jgi:lipopolysaccharide transport system ATP-binding protein
MYVRLAFSVAAHLAADILLVDEVLAVGDAHFQAKCLGKMTEVASAGRTVLFVSHNMSVISRLCTRTVLLRGGRLEMDGDTRHVVSEYLSDLATACGEIEWSDGAAPGGRGPLRYRAARVCGPDGHVTAVVGLHCHFFLEVEYEVLRRLSGAWIGLHVISECGDVLFASGEGGASGWQSEVRKPGKYRARCRVEANLLNDGRYAVKLIAYIPGIHVLVDHGPVLSFEVLSEIDSGGAGKYPGYFRPQFEWEVAGPLG